MGEAGFARPPITAMSTVEFLQDWIWEIALGLCAGLVLALMASRFIQARIRARRIAALEDEADIDDLDSAHANFQTERIKFFIVFALAIVIIVLPAILK